jgi:quinol monooxygenase YgiN
MHGEEGCGSDDPARLAFIERWASREALDAHLANAHIQDILGRAGELWGETARSPIYESVPTGEEKKGSIAAHAGG